MVLNLTTIEEFIVWAFLAYVLLCSGAYLLLNLIAFDSLRHLLRQRRTSDELSLYTGLEPPITLIVPAYNEGRTIVISIQSILQLHYPNLEVIIVNDGSSDNTLDALVSAFDLEPFSETVRLQLKTQPVRCVYLSRKINGLRLVDKENGGKADAINAGINISRSPLFCCIDADSILERSALIRVVQPFLNDPGTVASGGTVRIANGCKVRYGHIIRKGIPSHPLATFQLVEYLRAFLFGRVGWARINGLLIISGAFGLFRKESVVAVGGYLTDTIGEDMELILRLHRILGDEGKPHRVSFVPDPVCWTEAPERFRDFSSQRVRWHRGLSESLFLNKGLAFERRSGTAGWIAYPFFVFCEWLSPFVELAGYLFTFYLLIAGKISWIDVAVIGVFAVSLSVFLSTIGLLLDEITFPGTTRIRELIVLFAFSILECFGYRQVNMYFKLKGAVGWMAKSKRTWGSMSRSGSWQQ